MILHLPIIFIFLRMILCNSGRSETAFPINQKSVHTSKNIDMYTILLYEKSLYDMYYTL
jgi:hypothetical protein